MRLDEADIEEASAGRRLDDSVAPFFADRGMPAYPLPLVLVVLVVFSFVIFFWEAIWLQTTLFSKRARGFLEQAQAELEKYAASLFQDSDDEEEEIKKENSKHEKVTWCEDEYKEFWCDMKKRAKEGVSCDALLDDEASASQDVVGFSRRNFTALEQDGVAKVTLQRTGPCREALEVKLTVKEAENKSSFTAKAGEEFADMKDTVVTFAPGEKHQSLEIKIIETDESWQPTRHFEVRLDSVSPAGAALFGGPSLSMKRSSGPTARVNILQASVFPFDIPADQAKNYLRLLWFYLKERKQARGIKFWKTMAGMLYVPFHSVVVVVLVEKVLIDMACDPQGGSYNNFWLIAGMVILQASSVVLLRWGDVVQTRNRGRTGGVRQAHRIALFSKLMNLDRPEMVEFESSRWLYTALVDVENMTVQAYWQAFEMSQNIFALVLTIVVLFLTAIWKAAFNDDTVEWSNFYPSIGVLVLVPISLSIIWRRRHKTMSELMVREESEMKWVDSFSWLSSNARGIHSLGVREVGRIERNFEQESKIFVKHHQAARDLMNDSVWVTQWISQLALIVILAWGAHELLESNKRDDGLMQAGDFVLLIKIYSKFGQYLVKVNKSFINLSRGAVSLRRVCELLNLMEHGSMRKNMEEGVTKHWLDPRVKRSILLEGVQAFLPRQNIEMQMSPDAVLQVPLGRFVRVKASRVHAGALSAFLQVVGGVLHPTVGKRICDTAGLVVTLSPIPTGLPHLTVLGVLSTYVSEEVAGRAARALGFDPKGRVGQLQIGELQALELLRVMMRSPEVLVLDSPLALVPPALRPRMQWLLRAWQAGVGSERIVERLADSRRVTAGTGGLGWYRPYRTLVITHSDAGEELAGDVTLELDAVLDTGNVYAQDYGSEVAVSNL